MLVYNNNNKELFKFIIEKNSSNLRNKYKHTILIYSLIRKDINTAKYLLEQNLYIYLIY